MLVQVLRLNRLVTPAQPIHPRQPVVAVRGDPESAYLRAQGLWWNRITEHQDHLLPFRNSAQSRFHTLSQASHPFQHTTITPALLFSAACLRAVFHGSQFLLDQNVLVWDSLDAFWDSIRASEQLHGAWDGAGRTYFVNARAYGTASNYRVSDANRIWSSANNPAIFNALFPPLPTARPSVIEFIRILRSKETHAGRSRVCFPQLGPLAAFQLAMDYVDADLLAMPSVAEMGQIVFIIGKGALRGLKALGYTCQTVEETTSAFEEVFAVVDRGLSDIEKERCEFSVMQVEHHLCKYPRLLQLGFYRSIREYEAEHPTVPIDLNWIM